MGKTWFITGTSTGLGRVLAEQLLARGDKVVATLRRSGPLDDLKKQYAAHLHVINLDVTDAGAIRDGVAEAFNTMGRIDVIVSNAAYGLFGAAEELTDEQINKQIATNLTGSIQLIRAVLPYLRDQGGGRIVQISSEGGQVAYPSFSLYHATKWGIEGFIESVAQETKPFGIDFIIVEPGPTATNFKTGLDIAAAMNTYQNTPAGDIRRAIEENAFPIKGDATKTVNAMIRIIDMSTPPFRLPLGSVAYEHIKDALDDRKRLLSTLKDVAYSADND